MSPYSHDGTPKVRILISHVNFYVALYSPLESNLKKLEQLYHLTVDKVDLNMPLIDTVVEINSFLKSIYSDLCNLTKLDEKEHFLKTLFDTVIAFIEVLKKNSNLEERDKILKLISKTPIDIYEIFFAFKLDNEFCFSLKLYHWLKLENKLYHDRISFGIRYSDGFDNSLFTENELNDFFINHKWEIINYLQDLANRGCKNYDGTYEFRNPLNDNKYKIPYEMSKQISGLKFVDVN